MLVDEGVVHEPANLIRAERLFQNMPGAEEFGDTEEVLLARRAGHGDDAGVEKFPGEFQYHFHPVLFRHQDIRDHQIGRLRPIERQSLAPVGGFPDRVAVGLQHLPQQEPQSLIVVDDQN